MNQNISIETFKRLSDKSTFDLAIDICRYLHANNAIPYFVGGCVRDAILGHHIHDFDIEVINISFKHLEQLLSSKYNILETGKSFCVIKIANTNIDISVPRKEHITGKYHRSFDIQELSSDNIKEAASRRDFTINAIYFDVIHERLIDIYDGISHLKSHKLCHVSEKFSEDPLRVLRGMQFAGRFLLHPDPSTISICQQLTPKYLSKERIYHEWEKLILLSQCPSFGIKFLKNVNWLKFFPEIEILDTCQQNPIQHPEGSVLEHTCLAIDSFARTKTNDDKEDIIIGFATLCHDFGKPYTTTFDGDVIQHYGHDKAGIEPAHTFLSSIGTPKKIINDILPLIRYHMIPRNIYKKRHSNVVNEILQLSNNVGRIDRLCRVCYNDTKGRKYFNKHYDGRIEKWLKQTAKSLNCYNKKPTPIITGKDLINLKLTPSKIFTKILNDCFQAQLNDMFHDHESGLKYLHSMINESAK